MTSNETAPAPHVDATVAAAIEAGAEALWNLYAAGAGRKSGTYSTASPAYKKELRGEAATALHAALPVLREQIAINTAADILTDAMPLIREQHAAEIRAGGAGVRWNKTFKRGMEHAATIVEQKKP